MPRQASHASSTRTDLCRQDVVAVAAAAIFILALVTFIVPMPSMVSPQRNQWDRSGFALSAAQLCGTHTRAMPGNSSRTLAKALAADASVKVPACTKEDTQCPWVTVGVDVCVSGNGEGLSQRCSAVEKLDAPPFLPVDSPTSEQCAKDWPSQKQCRLKVPGVTVLLDMYQPHLAHFAEGFFTLWDIVSKPAEHGLGSNWRLVPFTEESVPDSHPTSWMQQVLDGTPGLRSAIVPPGRASTLPYPRRASLAELRHQARLNLSQTTDECTGVWQDAPLCFERVVMRNAMWFQSESAAARMRTHFYQLAVARQASSAAVQLTTGVDRSELLRDITSRGDVCSSDGVPPQQSDGVQAYACVFIRPSRRISNISTIRDWFLSEGIAVLYLNFDGTTLEEQIVAMSLCQILVTPHGAQLTNAVFLPAKASVLEVIPWGYNVDHYFSGLGKATGLTWLTHSAQFAETMTQERACWNPEWSEWESKQCGWDAECSTCLKNADVLLPQPTLAKLLRRLLDSSEAKPRQRRDWKPLRS